MADAAGAESVISPVAQYVRTRPQARSSKARRLSPVLMNLYQRPRVAWAMPMPSGIIRMKLFTRRSAPGGVSRRRGRMRRDRQRHAEGERRQQEDSEDAISRGAHRGAP